MSVEQKNEINRKRRKKRSEKKSIRTILASKTCSIYAIKSDCVGNYEIRTVKEVQETLIHHHSIELDSTEKQSVSILTQLPEII